MIKNLKELDEAIDVVEMNNPENWFLNVKAMIDDLIESRRERIKEIKNMPCNKYSEIQGTDRIEENLDFIGEKK
jgi:hypothetical protein